MITDSGGVQKEAYFAGVPAIVLMADTGWIELIKHGWNVLVDSDKDLITEKALNHVPPSSIPKELYGDGKAGGKIAKILVGEDR